VPGGNVFIEIDSRPKLANIASIVTTVGATRVKPCESFIVNAQIISRRPATSKSTHVLP
jgi:hypothetical protein